MYLLEFAGEDDHLAVAEAKVVTDGCHSVAPGIGLADKVALEEADRLALTRRINRSLGVVEGTLDDLVSYVESLAPDAESTVAVRARDVRGLGDVDTQTTERRIGDVLVRHGHTIDLESPDREFRVLATASQDRPRWFIGWLLLETPREYTHRAPPLRPFRQPGTMDPLLARVLVNLTGVHPGDRLLDPMCGPGGVLIEAALVGVEPIGIDVQRKMVRGARQNIEAIVDPTHPADIVQGTAAQLPIRAVDAIVFDAPYGRQSPIEHTSANELVEATLNEAIEVTDRCVAVFDAPIDALATACGWSVIDTFERRVHRSLTRYISCLQSQDR